MFKSISRVRTSTKCLYVLLSHGGFKVGFDFTTGNMFLLIFRGAKKANVVGSGLVGRPVIFFRDPIRPNWELCPIRESHMNRIDSGTVRFGV